MDDNKEKIAETTGDSENTENPAVHAAPSSLSDLVAKAAQVAESPDTFQVSAGGVTLECTRVHRGEKFEYIEAVQRCSNVHEILTGSFECLKQLLYQHCPILQEYAMQHPGDYEPWDVVDTLFDDAEISNLYNDFADKAGISAFFLANVKNG